MTILIRALFALSLAVVISASVARAQTPAAPKAEAPAGKPGVVVADVTRITATVEAIDQATHTVTLKGWQGRTVTLTVPPEAKNFDQIKVGDKVKTKYVDAVAIFVRKANDPPNAAETQAVAVAPRGQKPLAAAINTVEVSANVEKIDYQRRLITLKGPEGNVRTLKVDPRVKRLNEIKVGDDIVLRRTEAVALEVTSPKP
jgi:Cu/Ag efflux protein CusF